MSVNETPEARTPVLELDGLTVDFPLRRSRRTLRAVDQVSLSIHEGETVGLIGESGSGKSTLGKAVLGLAPIASGQLLVEGKPMPIHRRQARSRLYRTVQLVFQDPGAALNPRMSVADSIAEPLRFEEKTTSKQRRERVIELLDMVRLSTAMGARRPHELSGGQRQRVCIARALAIRPKVVVCDEPVSALDVAVQADILNLFRELQHELKIAYLFISHDLSVVGNLASRIAVMYLGQIVEVADTNELLTSPLHPYTQSLIDAQPRIRHRLERRHSVILGEIPSALDPPDGCNFHTRCPYIQKACVTEQPSAVQHGAKGHIARCHYAGELSLAGLAPRTKGQRDTGLKVATTTIKEDKGTHA